jgi:pimeloyl-ACP methyl ester carboxylesterase
MTDITSGAGAGLTYLVRAGGQVPVVLLHGIGSHARSFVQLIEALDPRFSVLAWDAPGYGDSVPLAVEWPDASDYAAALNRLLAHLEISRCTLVGHSLGALIAARLAIVSAMRVTKLCLISPAQGYGVAKGGSLPPSVASRIEELDCLGPERFAAKRAPGLLGDPAARPDVLQSVEQAMAAVRRPGYDQAARMLASGRLLDDAAKISMPTAVVVGARDRITPPPNARDLFQTLPAAARLAYAEVAGAGHAVCQEQPVEIARIISSIVDSKAAAHA